MSMDALAWAFEQELPCAEKFILVVLADWADMDRKTRVFLPRVAHTCGIPAKELPALLLSLQRQELLLPTSEPEIYLVNWRQV
jgi:hypothetical protein